MTLTKKEQALVARAGRHGIVQPALAYEVWKNRRAKPVGFDFALVCAMLIQETAGGHNVFGHDPTIFVGAGKVTKPKYLVYRKLRDLVLKCQGVGGMQLTWGGYQDQADKQGGCWTARANYRVGFEIVRGNIARHGLWAGVAAYNGSGDAARAYANSVLAIRQSFEHLLSGARISEVAPKLLDFTVEEDFRGLAKVEREHAERRREDPLWLPH